MIGSEAIMLYKNYASSSNVSYLVIDKGISLNNWEKAVDQKSITS